MNVYENDLNITCLSLQVGETDREKRIVWSHNSRRKGGRVIYAKAEDYDRDGDFTEENSTVVEALTQINRAYDDRLSCKARLYGLEFDTEYVYSVGDGEEFDRMVWRFRMPKDTSKSCSFALVSDIHFNVYQRKADDVQFHSRFIKWNQLLKSIFEYSNDTPACLISAGDNASVCHMGQSRYADPSKYTPAGIMAYSERENEEFLSVPMMKSVAFATTLGNHDALAKDTSDDYSSITGYHYDMPHDDGKTGHYVDYSQGAFYFRCGQALIIGLNLLAKAQGCTAACSPEAHREFILRAIENEPDAKWRILVNHVPAYSYVTSADIKDDGTKTETFYLREHFIKMLKGIDIDIVFTGHQHAFSRSYHIKDGAPVDKDKLITETDENGYLRAKTADPTGALHYNMPATSTFSFSDNIAENRHEFYANYALGEYVYKQAKNEGKSWCEDYRGTTYNSAPFVFVRTDEDDEKYSITIQTVPYETLIPLDTYTIEKTK
ncbi:MAG: metallophosphoesterase family protein [Ruminococcaceae bacterium]|nr:metallophosphoesterase family protein [Oscillospiraceae bacterium]